jgi:hypothetical protein
MSILIYQKGAFLVTEQVLSDGSRVYDVHAHAEGYPSSMLLYPALDEQDATDRCDRLAAAVAVAPLAVLEAKRATKEVSAREFFSASIPDYKLALEQRDELAAALEGIERICRNGNPARDNTALIAERARAALAKVRS